MSINIIKGLFQIAINDPSNFLFFHKQCQLIEKDVPESDFVLGMLLALSED